MKEGDEVTKCMEILESAGIFAQRKNTGAVSYNKPCPRCKCRPSKGPTRFVRYGVAGDPDISGRIPKGIIGNAHAVPFHFEVKKTSDHVPSKKQQEFLDAAELDGCITGYGTSSDLIKLLNHIGAKS